MSPAEIILFDYGDHEVRTVSVDGAPWFVATDVAAVLGIRDAATAVRSLEEFEQGYASVRTPGGEQRVRIVNESGLYALIFRSRREEARAFRVWITSEVIPAIRRTGSYQMPQAREVGPTDRLDVLQGMLDQLRESRDTALRAESTADDAMEIAATTSARLDGIEGRHGWFSALAYARRHPGMSTAQDHLRALGVAAGRIGRDAGLEPSKIEHGHFGWTNGWPEWVWDQAVAALHEGGAS